LAQEGAKCPLPNSGRVLLSFCGPNMKELPGIARDLQGLGFDLVATESTNAELKSKGITAQPLKEILKPDQPIAEIVMDGTIGMVINTPGGSLYNMEMASNIRRAAVRKSIPMLTTTDAAKESVKAIKARRSGNAEVCSLQEYHG